MTAFSTQTGAARAATRIPFAALWLAVLIGGATLAHADQAPPVPAHSHPMIPRPRAAQVAAVPHKGAVASAHPLASEAGQEMLARGGNAFDAAIAVSAALAVVEPTSSGIGGGGFYLLHRASDGFDTMVDAREKAPGAASRDMYLDAQGNPVEHASTTGPKAAAIPGEPAALEYLARHYGKLPLTVSLAPAIRLAREGFPLYERLRSAIQFKRASLLRSPDAARVFLTASGEVPEVGTLIKQHDLADTIEAIAQQGAAGFYSGRIARDLVNGVRAGGGIWTLEDLAAYRVVERKPLIGEYHGARIVSASPPSSGGVALIDALDILSGYDLKSVDSATHKHLVVEAMQRAYRDRAVYLGDPDFVAMPIAQLPGLRHCAKLAGIRVDCARDAGGAGRHRNPLRHGTGLDGALPGAADHDSHVRRADCEHGGL